MLRSGAQNVLLAGVVITLRGALAQRKAPGCERKYRSYGLNSFYGQASLVRLANRVSLVYSTGSAFFLRASVKHLVQMRDLQIRWNKSREVMHYT